MEEVAGSNHAGAIPFCRGVVVLDRAVCLVVHMYAGVG